MTGDCAECGFPVLVQGSSIVTCPYCGTVNEAIAATTTSSILIGLAAVAGFVWLVARGA